MKKGDLIDVWTDGSYRESHSKIGAGYLIKRDGVSTQGSQTIEKLDRIHKLHGSDIAEIFGVAIALRTIPKRSKVHLRLDAQNIIDWLEAKRLPQSKFEVPILKDLFLEAVRSIKRMEHVEFIKVSGRQNADLKTVHDLSKMASGPNR